MKFEKSMKIANTKRTICEVVREINDMLTPEKEKVYTDCDLVDIIVETKKKIKEIHDMAKRMTKRLYEYNKEWDKEFWEANPDYEQDLLRRLK